MKKTLRCDITGCHDDAACDMQWGSARKKSTGTFCAKHQYEAWSEIKGPVSMNLMWFRIDQAGAIKEEMRRRESVGNRVWFNRVFSRQAFCDIKRLRLLRARYLAVSI